MRNGWLLSTVAVAALGLTSAALAADMPVKAPPPPPPPVFSWTGFYLGGNIGAAFAHNNWSDVTRGVAFGGNNGGHFLAGGQIGYNWQINNFLLGVEADADWLSRDNNNGVGVAVPDRARLDRQPHRVIPGGAVHVLEAPAGDHRREALDRCDRVAADPAAGIAVAALEVTGVHLERNQ